MSYNKIISKVQVGSVVKDGKNIILSVATKTSDWTRTEEQAKAHAPAWKKAVTESLDKIKDDTVEIVQRYDSGMSVDGVNVANARRETSHTSPNDPREHYTGVQFNAKNEGQSEHFPTKK